MLTREPAVAGQFYPDSPSACRAQAGHFLASGREETKSAEIEIGGAILGGIVPHAGWICSGAVAAEVIATVLRRPVETVVIFGAVHQVSGPDASVFTGGHWRTPLGEIAIDEELARAVLSDSPPIRPDDAAHLFEHSIEVQVPFVQEAAPQVKLLPVMVPPVRLADQVGHRVAARAGELGRNVVYLGSSDLTHYGPRYRFTPAGAGDTGLKWAKDVNDRLLLDVVLRMQADQVVPEAATHRNACGAGAIAATIAACHAAGARRARLLRHTTSAEVLRDRFGYSEDAVGYAGIIFLAEEAEFA